MNKVKIAAAKCVQFEDAIIQLVKSLQYARNNIVLCWTIIQT